MKRNSIILIFSCLVIFIGITIGTVIANKNKSNNLNNNENRFTDKETNTLSNEIELVTTSTMDEKTTPNTLLVFNTYYKKCRTYNYRN